MGSTITPLYRHAGGAMLRAAALPLEARPREWPTLSDGASCRRWMREAWELPGFATAVRYASTSFADLVETVIGEEITGGTEVRRVTLATMRYLLRTVGRPTPFGLFAGVAPIEVGGAPVAAWGDGHRAVIRADTLWLDGLIERLEAWPELLAHVDVVVSDLAVDRGDRIEIPRGPGRVSVRNTAVVRLIRVAAAGPVPYGLLAGKVADAFPAVPTDRIGATLQSLVSQGFLITNLRAPMTVTDPLRYLIDALARVPATERVRPLVADLRGIARIIDDHNAGADPTVHRLLRAAVTERMRQLAPVGRTAVAGDLRLDCRVTLPEALVEEMAFAVTALLRLTRQPRPDLRWNDWCREFCDRYGTGAVVPVTEATHPDAGIGLPAGYPASVLPMPDDQSSRRDEELLRLAWQALASGEPEIVLDDDLIAAITADNPIDTSRIPPHVELGARVRAASVEALHAGEFTFTVHPAQAFGTLTSRFGPAATDAGLEAAYATAPPAVDGALCMQMSFPPLFPHSENVARIPTHLPHVVPLGEHRIGDDGNVVHLDDLGIVAAADGLHLVSISRRRVVEPQVFHALALDKQAPPLARFLATLTRGFLARYTAFDWGPHAAQLPYLPRVRYRRAILTPATWRLTATDTSSLRAEPSTWDEAFAHWRQRWHCPDTIELHDEHRSLRLTLTEPVHRTILRGHLNKHGHAMLTETDCAADTAWIRGHVHEIVLPFARATPAARNLVTGPLPVVANTSVAHRPASAHTSWLYAQVFTHPERLDDLIRTHLPRVLENLDDDRRWWFTRYRSVRDTDHLRLRIRTDGSDQYAAVAATVGQWGQQLCDLGAASRLTFATYFPEVGRYGPGPAMEAAEAVFAADSHAVALAFRLITPRTIEPQALTAIGMVDIADGFRPDRDEATGWLLKHLAGQVAASADRLLVDHAAAWATDGTLPDGAPLPTALVEARQARRTALSRYRAALPPDADTDRILFALLHMHHNRSRLIDRADEAVCLRLARQIALTRRALTAGRTA